MTPRMTPRTTPRSTHAPWFLLAVVLVACAAGPAAAVRVNVTNCLPDWYQSSSPPYLQWQPLYADAAFDTVQDSHNLRLTVWGNVTGSMERVQLPPPSDDYWRNPKETKGKIVDTADADADDKRATTLFQRVRVLTYEPWHYRESFCSSGVKNGTCPLGPVFDVDPDKANFVQGLVPSVALSHDFYSSYAFASFAATMLIIYGNHNGTNIACMSATITPDLGGLSKTLRFLPLVILGFTAFAVTIAGALSPWGTTNMLHWSTNYGRDVDLLRLVTPGFGDCLQYIQFIFLTGGLSLSYPGFYQPVVSQVAWSSLVFNESLVTRGPSWQSVVDGIYVTDAGYGLHQLGQLAGMSRSADMWPGMMVWLCAMVAGVFALSQAGFLVQWLWRRVKGIAEEDLRAKKMPFSMGNVVRIVFNYMLMPIVALSTFQLVVARESPPYVVALAVVTLVLLLAFAIWILLAIVQTRPKSVLFDDLPTALRYGPLYNTFADEAAGFALIPIVVNVMRGIAIGAVQPSGVAQVVLLAICEVIQLFTLHAFRPFESSTSMNAYHSLFCVLRAITIMLMVAFVPSLGVTEGPKGWIGYAMLLIHGVVLVLGFFLTALQTVIEVVARMLGAGSDDRTGLTRGGLGKIFGMRQLSRRVTHREEPWRASQVSTQAMLDSRNGYIMATPRARSSSTLAAHHRHRSSSALDSVDVYSSAHRNVATSASSYLPGTPAETTTFSFLEPPSHARRSMPAALEASDPYYRPPRRRRETYKDVLPPDMATVSLDANKAVQQTLAPMADAPDTPDESRGLTSAPLGGNLASMHIPANRPDYMTREVDYYYGVRGPALNSEGPGRKLGTGPADPTGPVATATAWLRSLFTAKTKEKSKGFEVVRSSRMPPAMVRNGGFGDETPPEGIPVAMGVLRNGPIESDDDDDGGAPRSRPRSNRGPDHLLTDAGDPRASDVDDESEERVRQLRAADDDARISRSEDSAGLDVPSVTEAKTLMEPQVGIALSTGEAAVEHHLGLPQASGLPFERPASQRRLSSKSSLDFPGELVDMSFGGATGERPASYGMVPHLEINRVDPELPMDDLLGSSAEVIDNSCADKTA
ncbi:hypothetical protein CDD82_7152 [Ophiocordyceps australis]|uniref:ML-like domain-containing protein n=1 Tax=Ophiocordyceps australis TaxID=1399860 RepID=A0A2C5XFD8_9HYPO|nr:hypothetical protein CDD82_7152 [Ophiocordyceps australis]